MLLPTHSTITIHTSSFDWSDINSHPLYTQAFANQKVMNVLGSTLADHCQKVNEECYNCTCVCVFLRVCSTEVLQTPSTFIVCEYIYCVMYAHIIKLKL